MARAYNSAFLAEFRRGDFQPVIVVEIESIVAAYLTVLNGSAGDNDEVYVYRTNKSTPHATFTGKSSPSTSTEFEIDADPEITAQNLVETLNAYGAGAFNTFYQAYRFGAMVVLTETDGNASTGGTFFGSGDESAWIASPRATGAGPLYFCSGSGGLGVFGYHPAISGMTPVSREVDLESRAFSLGELELYWRNDGPIKDLVQRTILNGKKIAVYLGTPNLVNGAADVASSNFEKIGTWIIDRVVPGEEHWVMTATEPYAWHLGTKIAGHFLQMHHLDVLKKLYELVGFPSDYYDATSIDPDTYASGTDPISHWSTSRYTPEDRYDVGLGINNTELSYAEGVEQPVAAIDLADELTAVLRSTMRPDVAGKYYLKRLDLDAAAVRHIPKQDIEDVEWIGLEEAQISEVRCSTGQATEDPSFDAPIKQPTSGGWKPLDRIAGEIFRAESSLAKRMFGNKEANKATERELASPWYGSFGLLGDAYISDTATTIEVIGAPIQGFTGARMNAEHGTDTQDASAVLSSTRVAYFAIVGVRVNASYEPTEAKVEIVKCTAASPGSSRSGEGLGTEFHHVGGGTGLPRNYYTEDAFGAVTFLGETRRRIVGSTVYTISERGALGSNVALGTAAGVGGEWRGLDGFTDAVSRLAGLADYRIPRVFDVTQCVFDAQQELARHHLGVPMARIVLKPGRHIDLEELDAITFEDETYHRFGKSGADTSTKWEILSKLDPIFEDVPGTELTVAWLRDDVSPVYDIDAEAYIPPATLVPLTPYVGIVDYIVTSTGDPVTDDSGNVLYP